MNVDGLREPHPFTIAAAPSADGRITFVIRALGDFTNKLVSQIEPGMHAEVYAPYGRFERKPDCSREIWIGGGVGISPFLAWMRDDYSGRFDKVTLFYFFTPGREFPQAAILQRIADERGVEFVSVDSGPNSAEFSSRFGEIVRNSDPGSLDVAVCGPPGLLNAVRLAATESGLSASRIRHELFSFR